MFPASKGKAVNLDEIAAFQRKLLELEEEAALPLRLLADDTTPEALVSLMAANGGRMGVISDEGGIFDIIAGKYSSGKANLDVFLKAYTGSPLRVDRKGREPEEVECPTLTMLLMVQPVVLETIMENTEFAGRGFLARPLYALPPSLVGRRHYRTPPIPKETAEDYTTAVYALLSIPDEEEAQMLKVSPEADAEAERFFEALEPRLPDELEDLDGWAAKYHGQIMRIAGILHCCEHFQDAAAVPVSLQTMQAAETIGAYFLEHTQAAFQIMGMAESKALKDAKYILRRFREDGRTEINKRDLIRLCQRFASAEDMEPGLSELVRRGYIRIETMKSGKPGKPPQTVYWNPEAG